MMEDGIEADDIKAYLCYTIKAGNYLQVSETASVMLLDNEHRIQIQNEGRMWDSIDGDKVYFHLKPIATGNGKPKYQQRPAPDGRPICIRFNRPSGCELTYCKYSHVCMICCGDHSKLQHTNGEPSVSVPPRFCQQ